MNKPQIIYDFLNRIEPYVEAGTLQPYECLAIGLDVDPDSEDYDRLRIQLANNIYDVVDFIRADQPLSEFSWQNTLIDLISYTSFDPKNFYITARSLYPDTLTHIYPQIRIWELINNKSLTLNIDAIASLKNQTSDLINSFLNNNSLNYGVRAFIIKKLRKIIEALDHYHIFGNDGLLEILEESIGHTFTNQTYNDFMRSESSQVWKEYLGGFALIIGITDSIISIGSTIQGFLP
jgi:hypothetical protein